MSSELNPNHPVAAAMRTEWHKIAALLLAKTGNGHVVITEADLQLIPPGGGIAIQELPDGLHLRLVDQVTAQRLARENGGLPT